MSYEVDNKFFSGLVSSIIPASSGLRASEMLHGTTIGSLIIDNGQHVVVFSDGRVSALNQPVAQEYKKILTIDRHTRILIAGSLIICEKIAENLRAWVGYCEDTTSAPMLARAKVIALRDILFSNIGLIGMGLICSPILATYDIVGKRVARVWKFGPDGSAIESKDLATSGSGGNVIISLRKGYRELGGIAMSVDSGIKLARAAIVEEIPEIDLFSGGKVFVDVIGPTGTRTVD